MKYSKFEKLVVYPYCYEFFPVLSGLLELGKIDKSVRLVSPTGWGICGLDAGEAFGFPKKDIKILNDLENEICECKNFIIPQFNQNKIDNINSTINSIINQSVSLAKDSQVNVIDLRVKQDMDYGFLSDIKCDEIEITTPVVFVTGLVENVNKFQVLVYLSNSLKKRGYKVSTVGTRHYSGILDMHSFPQFMFDSISEVEKIEKFRSFVFHLQETEHPDVIVVGIPGASLPFNDFVPMGYGIMNYLVSMAVVPDFSILCTYYNSFDIEIINDERDKPMINKPFSQGVHLSISHTKDYAAAQIIIED